MARIAYGLKLFREILGFARENRAYWMVPLFLVLALAGFLIVGGKVVAPLLYTLF
jgi:hypothetical protein